MSPPVFLGINMSTQIFCCRFRKLCLPLTAIMLALPIAAQPYTPANDNVVLEQLPFKLNDASNRERRDLHQALAQAPHNLPLALRVAQLNITQSRISSDPRYLGYAQAALAPWWTLPQPPVSVLVLRAIVRQANHEFDAALDDLSTALQREPRHAQALLTRASILQARGDYAAAREACIRLAPLVNRLIGDTCLSAVMSLNGEARSSYSLLQTRLAQNPEPAPAERQWVEGLLAEMATRRGAMAEADIHYQKALAATVPDSYLLASYADFLLASGRMSDVINLLNAHTRSDPLLLRLALAEQALQLPEATAHITALGQRFNASQRRGEVLHRREQSRFTLHLLQQPSAALQLAKANWSVQREPADAQILLEAALACDDFAAAEPVLDWMQQTRLEDAQLAALQTKIRAKQR